MRSCCVVIAPITMSLPSRADAFEFGNAAEIDQIGGRGEPQLHHRDEAVAAGQRAAVVAELGEQADRFFDRMSGDDRRKRLVSRASSLTLPARPRSSPGLSAVARNTSKDAKCGEVCAAAAIAAAPSAKECTKGAGLARKAAVTARIASMPLTQFDDTAAILLRCETMPPADCSVGIGAIERGDPRFQRADPAAADRYR